MNDRMELYFNSYEVETNFNEFIVEVNVQEYGSIEFGQQQFSVDVVFQEMVIEVSGVFQHSVVGEVEEWAVNDYELTQDLISYIGQTTKDGKWVVAKVYEDLGAKVLFATVNNNPQYSSYEDAWQHRYDLTYTNFDDAF